jgi:hypothetical protein
MGTDFFITESVAIRSIRANPWFLFEKRVDRHGFFSQHPQQSVVHYECARCTPTAQDA